MFVSYCSPEKRNAIILSLMQDPQLGKLNIKSWFRNVWSVVTFCDISCIYEFLYSLSTQTLLVCKHWHCMLKEQKTIITPLYLNNTSSRLLYLLLSNTQFICKKIINTLTCKQKFPIAKILFNYFFKKFGGHYSFLGPLVLLFSTLVTTSSRNFVCGR